MILTHIHRRGEGMSYKYILIFGVILCIIGLWLFVPTIEGLVDTSTTMLIAIRDSGDGKADQDTCIAKVGLSSNPTWNVLGKSKFVSGSFSYLVSINSNGTMWLGTGALSATSAVSTSDLYTWARIGTVANAIQVCYDYPTMLYIDTNNIMNYADYVSSNPGAATFSQITSGKKFSWVSAHLGAAYAIGTDGIVWYTDNIRIPDWKNVSSSLSGIFTRVSFDGDEAVIVDNGGKTYYTRNATGTQPSWIQLNELSNHVSIQNGLLYRVDLNKNLYFTTSPQSSYVSWTKISDKILHVESIFQRSENMVTQRTTVPHICKTGSWMYANKCLNNCPPTHRPDASTGKCVGIPVSRTSRPVKRIPPASYTCPMGTNVVYGKAVCRHVITGETIPDVSNLECPPLYNVHYPNAECLSDCPVGSKSENTKCVFPIINKEKIIPVNTNFTCPNGYDAPNYTSCTPGVTCNMSQLCYQTCPEGYMRPWFLSNGTTCIPRTNKALGSKPKSQVPATIASSSYSCETIPIFGSSPLKYSIPRGNVGPIDVLSGSTCSESCPANYTDTGKGCAPTWAASNTPGFDKMTNPAREIMNYSCPSGYTLSEKICINTICDMNYTETPDGSCAPNITTREPIPATYIPRCPEGYTEYDALCYKDCDAGYNTVELKKCQMKPIQQKIGVISIDYNIHRATCEPNTNRGVKSNVSATGSYSYTCETEPIVGTLPLRYSIPQGNVGPIDVLSGSTCSESCPENYKDTGNACAPSWAASNTPGIDKMTRPAREIISYSCPAGYSISAESSALKPCNDDEELQGINCVKKCDTATTTQETSTCTPLNTTPTVLYDIEVCNKNEILKGGICISCPEGKFPDGEMCVGEPKVVEAPSTIKCTSSPFGSVKKWLCQTQEDQDALLKNPSVITSYVSAKDQICLADDPTTLMYFCQTVEDVQNNTGYGYNLRDNYYSTCDQLTKNYTDLSGSMLSIKNIMNGLTEGTLKLSEAKTTLTSIYNKLKCDTTPTDQNKLICQQLQNAANAIGSNSTDIQNTLNSIIVNIAQTFNVQESLLKNLISFNCK